MNLLLLYNHEYFILASVDVFFVHYYWVDVYQTYLFIHRISVPCGR